MKRLLSTEWSWRFIFRKDPPRFRRGVAQVIETPSFWKTRFPRFSNNLVSRNAWALLLLSGMWIAGCGKPTAPSSKSAANPAASQRTNTAAANSGMTAATNQIVMHRSVFDDTSKSSKDPFFPLTSRRERPATVAGGNKPQQPKLPPSSYLKVTGIWPSKTRPLALVNKVIFAPGERGEVVISTPGGEVHRVQVHCLEIRDRSIVISVDGESGTKELRMPDQP
jgi:hypothetical protein